MATATTPLLAQVAMRPQVLTDEVAHNTMIGLWTLFCVSTLTTMALTPRAWSAIRQITRARRSPPAIAFPGKVKKLGRYRILFLYTACILLLLESVNSLIYYRNLWVLRDGNAIAMNVIRTFTIYPAGPLLVMATSFRISLLLAVHPRLQAKLVTALAVITVIVMLIGMVTNVVVIGMNAEVAKNLVAWQSVVMFPSWMAPILAPIPLSIITMTLWSLKLSFGITSEQADSQLMTVPTLADHTGESPAHSGSTSGDSSQRASGGDAQAPSDYVHPSSLGITFKVLTLLLALYWFLYIYVVALYRPFPIHSTAITAPITALAIATESSFEWLVHAVARQRRQEGGHKRKTRAERDKQTSTTKSQLLAMSSALWLSKSGHLSEQET